MHRTSVVPFLQIQKKSAHFLCTAPTMTNSLALCLLVHLALCGIGAGNPSNNSTSVAVTTVDSNIQEHYDRTLDDNKNNAEVKVNNQQQIENVEANTDKKSKKHDAAIISRPSKEHLNSKPREKFNDFPPHYTKRLKSFVFRNTFERERNSKSPESVEDFFSENRDIIPDPASSLPVGPLMLSSAASAERLMASTADELSDRITPNTFFDKGQHDIFVGEDGDDDLLPPPRTRPFLHRDMSGEYSERETLDVEPNLQNGTPIQFGSDRSFENEPSSFEHGDNPGHVESTEASSDRFGIHPAESVESRLYVSAPAEKVNASTSVAISDVPAEEAAVGTSSDLDDQDFSSRPSTYTDPNKDFKDKNQFHQSDSQNFIPHFHNGPMPFALLGNFRPLDGPPRPAIRNFRQVSPPQPRFFISPNRFNANGDGVFHLGGGGGDFGRHSRSQLPSSHPPRFSRPEFYFLGEARHQRQPQRPHSASHQQFHGDDDTNHHSSAATTNLLGSGNFGIIRGGIFADEDNPEQMFRPFHDDDGDTDAGTGEDFFRGFRDFQPFVGPLNNALSSKSQNIHRSPSKTITVTTKPLKVSNSTTEVSSEDVAMMGQLMEEK